jgi:CheY-like chemotaxis protein
MGVTPRSVLLVEDDPGDVLLIREAFAEHKIGELLTVVDNGVDALRIIRREGEFAAHDRPDLVLLDLNLPRMSGDEVLAAIKADEELATIPVIILSTSEADEDVLRSYQLHANAFITKPVEFSRFREVVHQIDDFFIGVVALPPRGGERMPASPSS